MQKSYSRPPGSGSQSQYELPPVQSATAPPAHVQQNPPSAFLSAPPSRPGSGFKMAHLLQPLSSQSQSHPPQTAPSYSRYYESGSGSPEGVAILPDTSPLNGSAASGAPNLAPPSANMVHQQHQPQLPHKRAYRQRRKDPSCDACRERKVKCDASESASCTECTNRKVRCQFTKETNRRMSSIKQVQDLERQLLFTKQQLRHLRSRTTKPEYAADVEPNGVAQAPPKLPDIGCRLSRPAKPPATPDLPDVRFNLRRYGRGILKVPTPYRHEPKLLVTESPPLPPKNVADYLLSQYYSCIHSVMPVIYWPSFTAEFERVYRSGSLQGVTREWAAVLFSVFACGSLHTLDEDKEQAGQGYAKTACSIIDVLQDSFSLDHARAALLVSIFLYEVNSKSASWVWIGSAARMAQEIGLHVESGPWPTLEGEMRRRVWWGIYAWDRLLALEMGKPVSINDDDCDVDLPSPLDEQYMQEGGVPDGQQTTPLLATIHVVRSMGQLTKTLRCPTISPATLETFERYFTACLATFPSQYHPKSDQYLDPRSLAPILYLQNARFILHRHNISPFNAHEVRSSAMDYCTSACLDTAHLLSRCMRNPPGGPHGYDWRSLFVSSAGTLLCTHVWRCVLLLLFRREYTAALVCIQASAAIGDSRGVNAACGRYIAFFLKCVVSRLQSNAAADFERDEEMMAYVSGDMQGTSDGSWVWQGSETGAELEATSSNFSSPPTVQQGNQSPEETQSDWEGWEWLERTIQYLLSEGRRRQQSVCDSHFPGTLEPGAMKTEPPESKEERSNSYSRMTIASII